MQELFLVEPGMELKEGFLDMVSQYEHSGDQYYFEVYKAAREDFGKYVGKLRNNAQGIDIGDWVPTCSYWLTDDGSSVLGVIRIRTSLENEYARRFAGNIGYDIAPPHRGKGLGTAILRLGLEKAGELKLDRVLITCSSENYGSRRIIESNGGIFEAEEFDESENTLVRRYWIEL